MRLFHENLCCGFWVAAIQVRGRDIVDATGDVFDDETQMYEFALCGDAEDGVAPTAPGIPISEDIIGTDGTYAYNHDTQKWCAN